MPLYLNGFKVLEGSYIVATDGVSLKPLADNTYYLGDSTHRWKGLYMGSTILFINETANTGMTTGLTINQGAADNEIISLKSSDVAHGMTSLTETDTYAYFSKSEAVGGGLKIATATDGDATYATSFRLQSAVGIALDTTKSTAGRACVEVQGGISSGTTWGAITADGNLFAIRQITTDAAMSTVAIVDEDGDLWLNGGITTGAAKVFINETADTDITVGLSINQGAADDAILSFKSSDVTHTLTGQAEADTWGQFRKVDATAGGMYMYGLSSGTIGMKAVAGGATDTTTKATDSDAYMILIGAKSVANAFGAVGANGNLLAIRNYTTNKFLFDVNGDFFTTNIKTFGAAELGLYGNGLVTDTTGRDIAMYVLDVTNDAWRKMIEIEPVAGAASAACKIGFYGVGPVVQAGAIGNASGTDAAIIDAIRDALKNVGIIAAA